MSLDLISRATGAVLDETKEWRNRPLDPAYTSQAFWNRGLIHHSDQSSQYLLLRYSDRLAETGVDRQHPAG